MEQNGFGEQDEEASGKFDYYAMMQWEKTVYKWNGESVESATVLEKERKQGI